LVMDIFANAVCAGLPEHASEVPVEPEKGSCPAFS
jgi:hypothetical protein